MYELVINIIQHSQSLQKNKNKKQNYSSHIFQNARSIYSNQYQIDSLCCGSPKIQSKLSNNDKYKSYIQFMQSGKITPNDLVKRNSFNKRKTVTPTPRSSLQHTERKRMSVLLNYNSNPSGNYPLTSRPTSQDALNNFHHNKSSSMVKKQIPIKNQLCIKSKVMKNQENQQKKKGKKLLLQKQKFKIQGRKYPNNQKAQKPLNSKKQKCTRKINQNNQTLRSSVQAEQKMQLQQQKMLAKLFKGIQFHRDLGKGAHAVVKSAVDWNNNRKIAVKVYNRTSMQDNDIRNIERQVQILMSLQHQNIVKLYQIMQSYKTINLIMEYGGGNSLDQFIRSKVQGRLTEQEACKIFGQVLRAVDYLQRMNVVHRDLKPENVLLNKHLDVKIIDFGFSIICPKGTDISSYCGTPTYMAPEIVSKTVHNPHLSDRWSLGILLYTMLNGCCPFKAATQKQLFQRIVSGQFLYLSNISDESKDLINLFLCKVADQRVSAQKALEHQWVKKYEAINK